MKISIRFYNDREVRAIWNEEDSKWYFSAADVIGVLRHEDNYEKCRNYWKYMKNKLRKEGNQLVSATNRLKIKAPDGKVRMSDVLDSDGILQLAAEFPSRIGADFISWFTRSEDTIDGKSKQKAYALFDSTFIDSIEVGTSKELRQIHGYLFGGLYDFAGQIRTVTISKGGFTFANGDFLPETLQIIDKMPEGTVQQIVCKYVEMNVAHPFLEGNGRSTRIWLNMMLKKNLGQCVDWSRIDKREYLDAMRKSVADSTDILRLIENALTDRTDDREVFMKGIDYSYYYEEA